MLASIRLGTHGELWRDLVQEAEARAGRTLDEWREGYLVFMLLRHQQDAYLLARIQALEWLNAQEEVGTARADALRDVGDRCLLIAGLFPGRPNAATSASTISLTLGGALTARSPTATARDTPSCSIVLRGVITIWCA